MKNLLIAMITICTINSSYCQTLIKDKSTVFGIWTKTNSPYVIEREAIVPEGKSLTIEAGVRVEFKTGIEDDYLAKGNGINTFDFDMAFLRIEGTLTANGTKSNLIYFTNNDDEGRSWGNLYFSNSEDSKLNYCIIENTGRIVNIDKEVEQSSAAITLYNSKVEVENTIIRTGNSGVELTKSHLILNNSIIKDISNFAISSISSILDLNKTTVTNNEWTFALRGKVDLTIRNSMFLENYSDFDKRFINFQGKISILNSAFQLQRLPSYVSLDKNNTFNINPEFKADGIGSSL